MSVRFKFASGVVCERVLTEKDGVLSAIRIIDTINVEEGTESNLKTFVLIFLRSLPPAPSEEFTLTLTLIHPSGERAVAVPGKHKLGQASDPFTLAAVTIVLQTEFRPKDIGTWLVEIVVDEEVVIIIPVTLRLIRFWIKSQNIAPRSPALQNVGQSFAAKKSIRSVHVFLKARNA